ncbi:MAG: anhydro-N-acetylmuramic acid kinase [Succinivibrio sp.]
MAQQLYIGLMSGTSIDAMDGVVASFDDGVPKVLAAASRDWKGSERSQLNLLCSPGPDELELAGQASLMVSQAELEVVHDLLSTSGFRSTDITAIGAHGQTVRHRPDLGFTIQLSDPAFLAEGTGIDVISHFRQADLAAGGEGAPLTPAFHSYLMGSRSEPRYVLNLGGIANLTVMGIGGKVLEGYDTGPANTLIDMASRTFLKARFDRNGETASKGRVNAAWLARLMQNPYFREEPPKSTGRELFDSRCVAFCFDEVRDNPALVPDLLATLTEFTATSACDALEGSMRRQGLAGGTLVACGGGTKNPLLMKAITEMCSDMGVSVMNSRDFGIDPQLLEPLCFAWMAMLFTKGRRLPLGGASRAGHEAIAGSLTPAPGGYFERLSNG